MQIYRVGLVLFLFFVNGNLFAQKEQLEWIFGSSGVGLRFDPGTLTPATTSGNFTPFTREGCAVASNPLTGELMFYTDGLSVIDARHNLMPSGSGLKGNESSSQSGQITVKPGSCNQYYIFHNNRVAHEFTGGELSYTVVDLSLTGNGSVADPLGDAVSTEKNKLIDTNAAEGMMIVPDKIGSRFWLISPAQSGSLIRVYRIDEQGVALDNTFDSGISMAMVRSVRFSEQNGKIVIVSSIENDPAILLDFDSGTGTLSNPFVVPGTRLVPGSNYFAGFYDAEWSADGSKLYLSRFYEIPFGTGKIYQYDLDTPADPMMLIYSLPGNNLNHSSGLKRGPDGKIYHQYINLAFGDKRIVGVINDPNVKGNGCNYNPTAINLGRSIPLSHKFPEFLNFTDLDFLAVEAQLEAPFGQDTILCAGEELLLDAKNEGSTYSWNDGSTDQTLLVDQLGEYRVTIQNGCSILKDTINVLFMNPPTIELGEDLELCSGEIFELKIENPGNAAVSWNTGNDTDVLKITNAGQYIVSLTNQCGVATDAITVDFITFEENEIPNVITPNNDSLNDYFILEENLLSSRLEIVNRWGKTIYLTDSYQNNWNGELVSSGIYYYTISTFCNTNVKGIIQVIK